MNVAFGYYAIFGSLALVAAVSIPYRLAAARGERFAGARALLGILSPFYVPVFILRSLSVALAVLAAAAGIFVVDAFIRRIWPTSAVVVVDVLIVILGWVLLDRFRDLIESSVAHYFSRGRLFRRNALRELAALIATAPNTQMVYNLLLQAGPTLRIRFAAIFEGLRYPDFRRVASYDGGTGIPMRATLPSDAYAILRVDARVGKSVAFNADVIAPGLHSPVLAVTVGWTQMFKVVIFYGPHEDGRAFDAEETELLGALASQAYKVLRGFQVEALPSQEAVEPIAPPFPI